jgi:alkanesulfonate monooxygenase SsuD/methylene tetrahydromethanopterin reductase-like flavin-dependent oxidoreductase (luciferase family)
VRLCLSIEIQEGLSYADTLRLARAAEDLNFDAALLAEHYYPSGLVERYAGGLGAHVAADAWVYLAALARDTSRLRLGTLVSPVTFRHPVVLAKMAATLDHVSGGRAELGMGAGWLESEHAAFGIPFPSAVERVDELEDQLHIITGLWSDEAFSFSGRYALREARFTPKPAARIPILIGGRPDSRRLLRLAAQYADEYVITLASPEQCRDTRRRLDAACERAGRDPKAVRLALFTPFAVGEDAERRFQDVVDRQPIMARMAGDKDVWLLGSAGQVAEQIGRLEAAGVERLMLTVVGEPQLEMLPLLVGR